MGKTLSEAIERRKKVPDLSSAPKELRPLLAQMLAPDAAKRPQSMADVIEALDGCPHNRKPSRIPLALAATSAALLAGAGAAYFLFFAAGRRRDSPTDRFVRRCTDCSWLNLDSVTHPGGAVRAKLSGAARDIGVRRRPRKGPRAFRSDSIRRRFSAVQPQACAPLNAFRRFREPASPSGHPWRSSKGNSGFRTTRVSAVRTRCARPG